MAGTIKTFLATFFVLSGLLTQAQQKPDSLQGHIKVIRDLRVDTLLAKYNAINREKAAIPGYRIQVIASPSRTTVNNAKARFYNYFPDIDRYVIWQQPNYKLRVGNYRTRLDAYKDLQNIRRKFEDAFIITDVLNVEDL